LPTHATQPAVLSIPPAESRLGSPVQAYLEDLQRRFSILTEGDIATYIPELAKANPDWFSLCMSMVDGMTYVSGNSDQTFTIQSMSKALVFALALEDNGWEAVLRRVGVEPSGEAFNSIVLDERYNRPFNPMVNAGAIATTALIKAGSPAEREARILDYVGRFAGRAIRVDEAVFRSERETGHRNRAIAHLMRNFDMVHDDVDAILDAYFRQCSILVDCRDLSVIAATLANGGVNPVTGVRVLSPFHERCVLSVMGSCGMYDFAGEWGYKVGMPAKSGVSGGIIAVLPGQLGIGVFSPRVDSRGNPVRGIKVCEDTAERFGLHQYDTAPNTRSIVRREYRGDTLSSRRLRAPHERDYLVREGHRVLVVELQGRVLFGSAERLLRLIETKIGEVQHLILDFRRVSGIDANTAFLMAHLRKMIGEAGATLYVTGAQVDPEVGAAAAETLLAAEPENKHAFRFDDIDGALEAAEQTLIARGPTAVRRPQRYALSDIDLFKGLSGKELNCLELEILAIRYGAGELVFREGDSAQVFFVLASGTVSVLRRLHDGSGSVRLATIGPGVAFGGMALLDQGRRSADIRANEPIVCYAFSMARLEEIGQRYPRIQLQLMRNLAQEMASRLRRANDEIAELFT
jgi:glutaminase